MLRGSSKSTGEVRFELVVTGSVLVTAALLYLVAYQWMPGLMLFFPGLIMLGGAIYQDMQPEWKAGWLTYVIAILLVSTGLASIINTLFNNVFEVNWLIIAIVELGLLLILKALYDPTPRS
jgi:hypothetical protein